VKVLFDRPGGRPVRLRRRPVLESWDAADHPHRLALTAFLDELEHDLGWGPRAGQHLALELTVGLPDSVGLDHRGHDLDNYLFPIVDRLGPVRFDAVFARKQHGEHSFLRIAPATAAGAPPGPAQVQARLTPSATSIAWKEDLHAACVEATPEPAAPGPLAVEIRLSVSRRRNWSALWKPAIDSLGPILGLADPHTPYRAYDDRITTLALHRHFDDTLGHRVGVEVWWQPDPG
jgi:hypothetical protein